MWQLLSRTRLVHKTTIEDRSLHDVSAPDNPTHHAVIERRNQGMEKLLDVAISKGDLNNADDLSGHVLRHCGSYM